MLSLTHHFATRAYCSALGKGGDESGGMSAGEKDALKGLVADYLKRSGCELTFLSFKDEAPKPVPTLAEIGMGDSASLEGLYMAGEGGMRREEEGRVKAEEVRTRYAFTMYQNAAPILSNAALLLATGFARRRRYAN